MYIFISYVSLLSSDDDSCVFLKGHMVRICPTFKLSINVFLGAVNIISEMFLSFTVPPVWDFCDSQ